MKLDCPMYSKQKNKLWSLKSLVMLKCESRTSLHAAQHRQPGSVVMFCHYFRNGYSKPGFVLSFFLNFSPKSRLLFLLECTPFFINNPFLTLAPKIV